MSQTAVYWLLCNDGFVCVVPAKLLEAVVNAKADPDQETITIHYVQVRHAAVSLESYLVDLSIGGWIGSGHQAILDLADGARAVPSATTSTAGLFEFTIRWSPG